MIGFSIISQAMFYHIHQPVVRLLMGPGGFESLTLDVLADHIAQFSLAAIGKGPPIAEGAAAPSGPAGSTHSN
jgi:hypothetical protein